eukprot:1160350-Pelagomonas_calceolata.AAC.7
MLLQGGLWSPLKLASMRTGLLNFWKRSWVKSNFTRLYRAGACESQFVMLPSGLSWHSCAILHDLQRSSDPVALLLVIGAKMPAILIHFQGDPKGTSQQSSLKPSTTAFADSEPSASILRKGSAGAEHQLLHGFRLHEAARALQGGTALSWLKAKGWRCACCNLIKGANEVAKEDGVAALLWPEPEETSLTKHGTSTRKKPQGSWPRRLVKTRHVKEQGLQGWFQHIDPAI